MKRIRLTMGLCLLVFPAAGQSVHSLSEIKALYRETERVRKHFEKKHAELAKRFQTLKRSRATLPNIVQGRLTSVSGEPVTATETVNTRRIRFTPYKGNLISLYYKSYWRLFTFSELTLDLNGTAAAASTVYDVFVYRSSASALALELGPAWTNDTTRSTELDTQDGILVKGGDPTRRYLGTVRTNASASPNERFSDTMDVRGLWNYYNRVPRPMRVNDSTDTWQYNLAAFRQADGLATNQLSYVVGANDVLIRAVAKGFMYSNDASQRAATVGIGIDSATTNSAKLMGGAANGSATLPLQAWAEYLGYPGLGYKTFYWIESCSGCTTTVGQEANFFGDNGSNQNESGLMLEVDG